LVGFYLPKLYVRQREGSRLKKLHSQLVDTTTMISNSLKSGYSFVQGLELVSREMPPPISEEMGQVLGEMRIGSTAEEALMNLTKRVNSYDVELIVTSMLIQRQVGGNLAEVLDNIANTIRTRIQIKQEIKALTSEARLSAYILGALPFVLIGLLMLLNREYLVELVDTSRGQLMLAGALVMEVLGFLVMKRIVDAIEF